MRAGINQSLLGNNTDGADSADSAALVEALRGYTVDAVQDALGPLGQDALDRVDIAGAARALRGRDDAVSTLVRLFVLGLEVDERAARRCLGPAPSDLACASGLLAASAGSVRALVDVRPYGGDPAGPDWLVVSDLGSDVRPGPLHSEHVLGVGSASLTLAQITPRDRVGRALDVGTGCGIQALHLATHADEVVATDISARALRFAATSFELSGFANRQSARQVDLLRGSLLEPVAGQRFDLVVANPPFVVSAGRVEHDYRDSGIAADGACEALVRGLPAVLATDGAAHLLANWVVPADGSWRERVADWLSGAGCDAWVRQREILGPGEYVTMWLRDAGLTPHMPQWAPRYDRWLDYFESAGIAAVGMGQISMWRTAAEQPVMTLEDVPQATGLPLGAHVQTWVARQRWLRDTDTPALLATRLRRCADLVQERQDLLDADGWRTVGRQLRQSHGPRWTVEADEHVAAVVAACDGTRPLLVPALVLAGSLDLPTDRVTDVLVPVVRDLVGRGVLVPEGLPDTQADGTAGTVGAA